MRSSLLRLLVCLSLATVSIISLGSCSSPNSAILAITHVTVIDATGSGPQLDSTVIISKARISAVGKFSSVEIPRGARIVDGSGKFLIPGLADMHLHLTGAGEPNGSREFELPLLVANGITTVRDMGGKVEFLKELRKEIASGKQIGPQIFFVGPYLDGNPPSFQPSIVVQNAAEAAAAVQKLKAEGVDFIKVQSRLQPEAYFAIASESKKLGIRFVGHVPDSITAAQASDAGQFSIEHLTGVLLACSTREKELRQRQLALFPQGETPRERLTRQRAWEQDLVDSYSQEKAAQLFKKFAANGTWQVPTFPLIIYDPYIPPAFSRMPSPLARYLPGNLRKMWEEGRAQGLGGGVNSTTVPDYYDGFFELQDRLAKSEYRAVREMNAAGVPIMAGTDATAPTIFPGFSLHRDLLYLVEEAGLTPMQALQAATSKPAQFLGRSAEQGTITVGKRADLVLLDADPLQDIGNTEKIRAVVLNGKLLERPDLDALLAGVERFATTH